MNQYANGERQSMKRRPLQTFLGAGALLVALPAWAGEPSQLSTAISHDASSAVLDVNDGKIELSLDEAIAIALERNLGLTVERYNRAISLFGVHAAEGMYDLNLTSNLDASSNESLRTNPTGERAIVSSKSESLSLGLAQLFSTGGTVSASINSGADEFGGSPRSWGSTLQLGIRQPLLRNFGKPVTERNLLIARLSSEQSRQAFERQVAQTIQDVENAYWTLVESIAQVKVAEEGLKLANDLHGMNKIRVDVGTLAPLELVQSEVGIATREEDIIRTRYAVGNAADSLRRLLNLGDELWSADIAPTTDAAVEHVDLSLTDAISAALAKRPEAAQQRLAVERQKVDVAFLANQVKPRLDLTAGYGFNGKCVGGSGLSDSLQQIKDRDLSGWQVGLALAIPIQNRTARAERTISELGLDQAELQLRDLEQGITAEVRQAVRNVETSEKAVQSARISRTLAEKNLDAERKRYENGLSTSFQVLQIQEELTSAASREVASTSAYRRALASYYRIVGGALAEANVELLDEVARIENTASP